MLCFHGYGMHGKQFAILEPFLGERYTFYGFDLFFHKETRLNDPSLEFVKRGLSKSELAQLVVDFCLHVGIGSFSVLSYSMGTHYATALVEKLPERINEYIATAPSCLKPGAIITFLSTNKLGNRLLEKLILSDQGMFRLLKFCRKMGFVDDKGQEILHREIATPELRFSFYACATYLRGLRTDFPRLIDVLNQPHIKSIFIFGKRDSMFPPSIGRKTLAKIPAAKIIVLDENHEMIKHSFAQALTPELL